MEFSNLTIREKIGQFFFIGLPGKELDSTNLRLLEEVVPGGVCLFARNIKDARKTRAMLDAIRDHLDYVPFLSIDQEGGLVDRLRRILEPMPSAKLVGASMDLSAARKLAEITAEALRILGFNMNFAPVVDVPREDGAGCVMESQSRVFGNLKKDVFGQTSAYLNSLQAGGIIGCLKHFPGIGSVGIDPHETLPSVNCSRETLFETDLYPYLCHFESNTISAVMTGHTLYPRLDLQETNADGKLLPSSLSRNIVTNLLRRELGFENLALTDDLEMGAIINEFGIGEAAKMAINAGNDLLLICNDPASITEAHRAVTEAVDSSEITEARLDESLTRLWRVRKRLEPPLEFSDTRLHELSNDISDLHRRIAG